jgi:hypothetical protein
MREIRQSGSEGGAVMSRPYPYRLERTRGIVMPAKAGIQEYCRKRNI